MSKGRREQYARLLVEVGLNLQQGQPLVISCPVDCAPFARLCAEAAYDAVKQGGFSRYFDRDAFGLYLVKKLYCGADEQPLTVLAQMAVDSAVYRKVSRERPGVLEIRKKAFSDTLEYALHPPRHGWPQDSLSPSATSA